MANLHNPNSGIYKIISPTNKVYIGQSINVHSRKKMYAGLHCHKQAKLHASLKKHGFDAHSFEVIEFCEEGLLNEREEYYIKFFDTFNTAHGLNLCSGGLAKRVSEETKLKISKGNTGNKRPDVAATNRRVRGGIKLSQERIENISKFFKGRKLSEDVMLKRKGLNVGRKHTAEARKNMSLAASKKIITPEHKQKISDWFRSGMARRKKVINTETGEIFASAKIAYKQTSFKYDYFKSQLNGLHPNKTGFAYL